MTFDLAGVRKQLAAITPGPWTYDVVHNEGSYGSGGPDESTGFSSYAVIAEKRSIRGGELVVEEGHVCDCSNSDFIEVKEEHGDDEDGGTAWDDQGRRNMEFIADAPANLKSACDEIERRRNTDAMIRNMIYNLTQGTSEMVCRETIIASLRGAIGLAVGERP